MAGVSRRFVEAGYLTPKYMLSAHGRSVFSHAVSSFSTYFETEKFLFVVREVANTPDFVRAECRHLGIVDAKIVVLDATTRGQAETVALGLSGSAVPLMEPLTIFNIDTFRPKFTFPDFGHESTDGYLEVFRGEGSNWSYVRPAKHGADLVAETAEKQPISNLCCTGLYQFGTAELFHKAYAEYLAEFRASGEQTELYVAPMYNLLIRHGLLVRYAVIERDEVIFCGIPAEYEEFCARVNPYASSG